MNFLRHSEDLDAVVPGVTEIYRALRDSHGQGLYTSLGRYYNHTIFGRDAGMTAKFVSHFDHQVAWDTILTLASHQGVNRDDLTHEQAGRIHHELRDYTSWQGIWYDRLGLWAAGKAWGINNKKLLTYYAADTTATYVRLVHKYASSIDKSILERLVPQKDGSTITLADSVASAANWITRQTDEAGVYLPRRQNRWSLPYQTFADSVSAYAWQDGRAMDTSRRHGFVEVQAYALDALQDAARLLPMHASAEKWRSISEQMHQALLEYFWADSRHTFSPAIVDDGGKLVQLDTEMITCAWTLNASFWKYMPDAEHRARIIALVRQVLEKDFLTEHGIRTKSLKHPEPLGEMIDYHGSQTIWPMFNFMVIEGLRRHGLFRLARQLENRLLNTVNALGDFPEFFIVDKSGVLYRPERHAKLKKSGQMIPEQNIAFTVVPSLTLAYRHLYRRSTPAADGWRYDLEEAILRDIPNVELLSPADARASINSVPLKIQRTRAGLRSVVHIAPVILKKPS